MQFVPFFSQLQHNRRARIGFATVSDCRIKLNGWRPPSPSPSPPDNFYGLHALRGGRIFLDRNVILYFVHRELHCLWITGKIRFCATQKL